jgi:hypothetical protein
MTFIDNKTAAEEADAKILPARHGRMNIQVHKCW